MRRLSPILGSGRSSFTAPPRADEMDLVLHAERLDGRAKRLHRRNIDDLPDGACIALEGRRRLGGARRYAAALDAIGYDTRKRRPTRRHGRRADAARHPRACLRPATGRNGTRALTLFHRRLDRFDALAGLRRVDHLRFLRGEPGRRGLHRIDGVERHDHGAMPVGVNEVAASAPPCRGCSRRCRSPPHGRTRATARSSRPASGSPARPAGCRGSSRW